MSDELSPEDIRRMRAVFPDADPTDPPRQQMLDRLRVLGFSPSQLDELGIGLTREIINWCYCTRETPVNGGIPAVSMIATSAGLRQFTESDALEAGAVAWVVVDQQGMKHVRFKHPAGGSIQGRVLNSVHPTKAPGESIGEVILVDPPAGDEPTAAESEPVRRHSTGRQIASDSKQQSEAPKLPGGGPSAPIADVGRLMAAMSELDAKVVQIAGDAAKTADERLRAISNLDHRYFAKESPDLAHLLGVTEQAIRKTEWWRVDRPNYLHSGG